ncbi:uncharacterized protein LOC123292331 [Chrysoperla carnea]|uniref:uncharacterized protein LOC123292331 n=1 Tax=Chrysoperla carnea TaxID=189513 RepID=UPI001D05D1F8|nr:uncharacterized protein LOC123292331 [Chrysoperla carnea]
MLKHTFTTTTTTTTTPSATSATSQGGGGSIPTVGVGGGGPPPLSISSSHTSHSQQNVGPPNLIGNGLLLTRQQQQHLLSTDEIMENVLVGARNDFNTSQTSTTARYGQSQRNLQSARNQQHVQQPLNISTILNTSKHSLGGSSSISPVHPSSYKNGGLNISRQSRVSGITSGVGGGLRGDSVHLSNHHHHNQSTKYQTVFDRPVNISKQSLPSPHPSAVSPPIPPPPLKSTTLATTTMNNTQTNHNNLKNDLGIKEMLISLGLLCLISLLLALLSLIFLLKISPVTAADIREILRAEQLTLITAEEYVVVYEVTLALCALTLSLNLCCLLVCAIQFLFTVKLVKSASNSAVSASHLNYRTNKYLQKSSISRVCAVAGFFISIPVFLTGIILYTFIQFHSTPAIVTSGFIGLGIVFCGCAMVHNVFIWQREKTNACKLRAQILREQSRELREQYDNSFILQQSQHNQTNAIASSTQIFNGTSQNISITNPNLLNASSIANNNNNDHYNNNSVLINSSHLSTLGGTGGGMLASPSLMNNGGLTSSNSVIGKLTVAVGGAAAGVGGGLGERGTTGGGVGHYNNIHRRDASSCSISPNGGLNNNTSGISPHELSTLV